MATRIAASSKAWLDERVMLYDVLRRLYLEPATAESLALLQRLEVAPDASPAFREGMALMTDAADRLGTIETLSAEFTRLFLGPGDVPVPPFASCYLGDEGLVMQEVTTRVRLAYADAGFLVKRLYADPDDHIGIEFEFLYALSSRAAEAITRGSDDGARWLTRHDEFLRTHAERWMPRFCERLMAATSSSFFHGLALLTSEIVGVDAGSWTLTG